MEEEYDWDLIMKVALPAAAVEAYVFYINNFWKWLALIIGLFACGAIVYQKNRKKQNVFTAVGIVFLIVLITKILRGFGFI